MSNTENKPLSIFNFETAFSYLKKGHRITRKKWEEKGLWIGISYRRSRVILSDSFCSPQDIENIEAKEVIDSIISSLAMKKEDNSFQSGWLPSTEDLFAEDWIILQ